MGKAKGLAFIGAVKALRALREASERRIPERLRHYLSEKIFPSGWYPEEDLMTLLRVLVEVLPPRPDIWEWLGVQGAAEDFTGVYSPFVHQGRPELALTRYPRIWRLYHDNGHVKVGAGRSGQGAVEIVGDLMSERDFCRLQSGHFHQLLEVGGATEVKVVLAAIARGDQPAKWDLRWTPPR